MRIYEALTVTGLDMPVEVDITEGVSYDASVMGATRRCSILSSNTCMSHSTLVDAMPKHEEDHQSGETAPVFGRHSMPSLGQIWNEIAILKNVIINLSHQESGGSVQSHSPTTLRFDIDIEGRLRTYSSLLTLHEF